MLQRALLGITCVIFFALFVVYWGQIRISEKTILSYQTIKERISSLKKEFSPFIAETVRMVSDDGELHVTKAVIEKNSASCIAPRGSLRKENASFEAVTAQIIFSAFHPRTIVLDGSVRFFSLVDHRYTLADLVVIDFKENRASLRSIAPNRVLFQQDGIKMSAPEISIEREEVKALGDVRLFFEPKEIAQFEKAFENLVPKK